MSIKLPELWVTRRTENLRVSDPSDDPADSGGSGTDSGGTEGDENPEGEGGSGDSGEGKDNKAETVDRAELDKALARMRAADKRASEVESELKKIQDKDKSELEIAQRRVTELEKELGELRTRHQATTLESAILRDSEYPASRWHDPEDVLMRAERAVKNEDITIEEDGTIKGVGPWLKKLAKDKAHLLKPEDASPREREEPSGGEFNGKKKGDGKLDEAKLRRKYPALNF